MFRYTCIYCHMALRPRVWPCSGEAATMLSCIYDRHSPWHCDQTPLGHAAVKQQRYYYEFMIGTVYIPMSQMESDGHTQLFEQQCSEWHWTQVTMHPIVPNITTVTSTVRSTKNHSVPKVQDQFFLEGRHPGTHGDSPGCAIWIIVIFWCFALNQKNQKLSLPQEFAFYKQEFAF